MVEIEPSGLSVRGAAARLLVAVGIVLAASLGVAGLGDGGPGGPGDPVGGDATDVLRPAAPPVTAPEDTASRVAGAGRRGPEGPRRAGQRRRRGCRLRRVGQPTPGTGAAGGGGPGGTRRRSHRGGPRADGQRLVVDGLDPGTYRWSATSSSAETVTGKVRVEAEPTVVAVAESSEPSPAAVPTETPTATSLADDHSDDHAVPARRRSSRVPHRAPPPVPQPDRPASPPTRAPPIRARWGEEVVPCPRPPLHAPGRQAS